MGDPGGEKGGMEGCGEQGGARQGGQLLVPVCGSAFPLDITGCPACGLEERSLVRRRDGMVVGSHE